MSVKERTKSKRNCQNATQLRDEKHGLFIRRLDDGDVTRSVSSPALFRQGLVESKYRFPARNQRLRRALAA